MRKLFAAITIAGLLSSCSSGGSSGTTASSTDTPASDSGGSTPDGTDPGSTGSGGTTAGTVPFETTPPLTPVTAPSDCPDKPTPTTAPVLPDPVEKPEITLPDPLPSELGITDLATGKGRAAKNGDLVQVYYIGVRSTDGAEFDSNFGSGTPFPVTLGQGQVIPGWDQGLVGATEGTRRQLDIPANMAYGAQGQGEAIPPNMPLTFIVDIVSVQEGPPQSKPADDPKYEFPLADADTPFSTQTIIAGDRCDIAEIGSSVFINAKLVRGDTGETLESSWTNGSAIRITLDETTIWGLAQGIAGMGIGEQRLITIPANVGLGPEGNQANGLNPDTVILAYVEFVSHA